VGVVAKGPEDGAGGPDARPGNDAASQRLLQFLDLRPPAAIASLLHQLPRLANMLARSLSITLRQREAGIFEMSIALKEPHLGALGDSQRFVQIAAGRGKVAGFPE
jgi:hypothetical protein